MLVGRQLSPPVFVTFGNIKIAELLDPGAAALMLTFEYNQMEREGPPFSVSFKDVGAHFSGTFDVALLETLDLSARNHWGLSWVHEPVMRLNRSR